MLHIGKFYPPHRGGMETHLRELCSSLARDAEVHAVVAADQCRSTREIDGEVTVHRVGTWGMVASCPICPGMASAIASVPADIVHLHMPNPAAALAYLASGHSGTLILSYHSDIARQRHLSRAIQPILRAVLNRASFIISFSPDYVETSPTLRRYSHKCCVIPHGIDVDRIPAAVTTEATEIRRRFGSNLVLAVGRLVYYKGFEYLIRAIQRTSANLVIIGDGPLRGHLQQVACDEGVADRVHLLGDVDAVFPYYHACDIFVLPSVARSEAFGIVQLEAMACGKPIINTQLDTGVKYVSPHGATGFTVMPGNVAQLACAIETLVHNPQLRARFGACGARRTAEQFSLNRMRDRTLHLYRDALAYTDQYAPELQLASSQAFGQD